MSGGAVDLEGEEIITTVMFADIRSFTALSERMAPRELVTFLNEYFSFVVRPIAAERGVVNKFIGDSVMAVFSPVCGVEDHAEAAIRAAPGMREALAAFNAHGNRAGYHARQARQRDSFWYNAEHVTGAS